MSNLLKLTFYKNILESLKMIYFMDKEPINGRRETFMWENGLMAKCKGKESFIGNRVFLTMESIKMILNMVREK